MKLNKAIILLALPLLLTGCAHKQESEWPEPTPLPVMTEVETTTEPEAHSAKQPERNLPVVETIPVSEETANIAPEPVPIETPSANDTIIVSSESVTEQPEPEVPERNDSPDHMPLIYIDPGHGGDAACETTFDGIQYKRNAGGAAFGNYPANSLGTTSGTSGGGFSECDVVFRIAKKTADILSAHGYETTISRTDVHTAGAGGGTEIGNWERGRRAAGYDAWVVLHADGGGGSGFHCVVYNSNPAYSNKLSNDFITAIESKGRPVYTASGYNHGYSGNSSGTLQAPSQFIRSGGNVDNLLYIEAGFMDNPSDLAYMTSEQGMEEIAQSILEALDSKFKKQ